MVQCIVQANPIFCKFLSVVASLLVISSLLFLRKKFDERTEFHKFSHETY